ncbi:MAG: pyridine nucleotide-disulfide oxidoreductase, partial [Lautropia sp.]
TDGLLKAVVDAGSGEILGVTLLCAEAHEIINLFKMAIDNRVPAGYVRSQIFTHPTMAEALNDLFAPF